MLVCKYRSFGRRELGSLAASWAVYLSVSYRNQKLFCCESRVHRHTHTNHGRLKAIRSKIRRRPPRVLARVDNEPDDRTPYCYPPFSHHEVRCCCCRPGRIGRRLCPLPAVVPLIDVDVPCGLVQVGDRRPASSRIVVRVPRVKKTTSAAMLHGKTGRQRDAKRSKFDAIAAASDVEGSLRSIDDLLMY